MSKKQYSPKLKFQVVLEALSGEKTPGQIAKQYGIHPNSVGLWKKEFLERGGEVFAQDGTVKQYERRLACPLAIVVVLISHMEARQQAALSAGADVFISKSETPERVAERLQSAAETIRT